MTAIVYKIATRADWGAAQASCVYRGSAHDERDGFIHFSTAAQLAETARKYFSGVPDLVLLAVDTGELNKLTTPHPALLPEGEGTPAQRQTPSFPLPGGEGQGEGKSALRWEPSRGGDLFPHLYADLPVSAVGSVYTISLDENGVPILPSDLAS